jgi:tetratricopeptide (TPR) repeat protein
MKRIDYKRSNIYPIIAITLTVALWLFTLIFHPGRFWGMGQLAYFPIVWSLIYIAGLIFLFAYLSKIIQSTVLTNILASVSSLWKQCPEWLKFSITGIAALTLFIILRDLTKLLGDSIIRIGELGDKGLDRILNTSAAEPLDYVIHRIFYKYFCLPLGLNATICYEWIAYTAGLIYLWVACLIARQLKSDESGFWLPFLYLLGWGGVFMFFGYAEEYGLAASALLLFVYYSIKYINKNGSIIPVAIVFLIGFFLHNLLLILLPTILYLLFIEYKSSSKKAIAVFMGLAIPIAGWLLISFTKKENGAFLLPESGTEPGYMLWSGKHLLDIINELLLICPAILVMLSLQERGKMPTAGRNSMRQAIGLAAISGLIVLIFVDPQLSMVRDCDLFALPLLAFNVALFLGVDWSKVGLILKNAIIIIMLGFTFSWIMINAREDLALARYEKLLPLDSARARLGYDRLGFYYTSQKKYPEAEAAYKKSIEIRPNFRTILNLAYLQEDMGKNTEAAANLRELLKKEPMNAIVLYELGWLYYNTGQYKEALEIFRQFERTGEYAPDIDQAIIKLEKMAL